jgi:ribonuclease HI
MKFYAVHKGKKPGIYNDWPSCQIQVNGYNNPIFKKFDKKEDAEKFMKEGFNTVPKNFLSSQKRKDTVDKKNEQLLDDLLENRSNRIFVYSDGSCIKFKNGIFKAGYGIYIPEKNIKISEPLLNQKQTNNRAELSAIIETFSYLSQEDLKKEIIMITDSQYSIYIFDKTGENYEKANFMKEGKEVLNKDLIMKALKIKRNYNIKLVKVRAHTNKQDKHSKNNEIVDKLAKSGVYKNKSVFEKSQTNMYSSEYLDNIDMNDLILSENKYREPEQNYYEKVQPYIKKNVQMNELFDYDECSVNDLQKSKKKNNKGLNQWFVKINK